MLVEIHHRHTLMVGTHHWHCHGGNMPQGTVKTSQCPQVSQFEQQSNVILCSNSKSVSGMWLWYRACLTCTKPWALSPTSRKLNVVPPVIPGDGGRRTRSFRSSLATQGLWGQPGIHETLSQKYDVFRAGEIARIVKCFLCKHEDLSLIPRIHMVQKVNRLLQVILWTHTHTHTNVCMPNAHMCVHALTHKIKITIQEIIELFSELEKTSLKGGWEWRVRKHSQTGDCGIHEELGTNIYAFSVCAQCFYRSPWKCWGGVVYIWSTRTITRTEDEYLSRAL